MMALQWRAAGLPRLVREAPRRTPSGKILHLHRETAAAALRSTA
jgi:hypothetical protein